MTTQTKTYYERPPATSRAARRAWDHFLKKRGGSRGLEHLYYSPNYRGDGPHWVCQVNMRESDTMHWNFSKECLEWAESAWSLSL